MTRRSRPSRYPLTRIVTADGRKRHQVWMSERDLPRSVRRRARRPPSRQGLPKRSKGALGNCSGDLRRRATDSITVAKPTTSGDRVYSVDPRKPRPIDRVTSQLRHSRPPSGWPPELTRSNTESLQEFGGGVPLHAGVLEVVVVRPDRKIQVEREGEYVDVV